MGYLRDVRLDRVRDALLGHRSAKPLMAAQVAQEFGFFHMGHFAAHDQKRFGELPIDTLRRSRNVM